MEHTAAFPDIVYYLSMIVPSRYQMYFRSSGSMVCVSERLFLFFKFRPKHWAESLFKTWNGV